MGVSKLMTTLLLSRFKKYGHKIYQSLKGIVMIPNFHVDSCLKFDSYLFQRIINHAEASLQTRYRGK